MACELCVETTLTIEALSQELMRLRMTNKVLRTVNSALRGKLDELRKEKDELFIEFCETDKAAEVAMGELWGSAEFDCGPQDYQWMVEQAVIAMREKKARETAARRTNPKHTDQHGPCC